MFPIDEDLLRAQRDHLVKINNQELRTDEINEDFIDGLINLLDEMLDILDMEQGA